MKKLLFLLLFGLSFISANATTTLVVNLGTIIGGTPSGAILKVALQNCTNARVIGSGYIVPQTQQFTADSSGNVNMVLYDNVNQIDCSGQKISYYSFTASYQGNNTSLGSFRLSPGTFNLSQITPCMAGTCVPPISPNGDNTYLRLDGGNSGFFNFSGLGLVVNNPIGTQTINQPDSSHPLSTNFFRVTGTATLPGGYIQNTPTISQSVVQPSGTSMNVNVLNGVYNTNSFSGADIGAKINAVVSLCAGNTCPIFIPAGSYSFSTPINLATNVELYGAGEYLTVLNYTGLAAHTYAISAGANKTTASNGVSIHDFSLLGDPTFVTQVSGLTAIALDLSTKAQIRNMNIRNFFGVAGNGGGIGGSNFSYATIQDCNLENNMSGISVGLADHIRIYRNYISNHYSTQTHTGGWITPPFSLWWDGIITTGLTNSVISGNSSNDNGQAGIFIGSQTGAPVFGNIISMNEMEYNWGRGLDIGVLGDPSATNFISNTSIVGNHLKNTLLQQIWLVCTVGTTVTSNVTEYTAAYDTFFGASGDHSQMTGIALFDGCGTNIAADQANNNTIVGNSNLDFVAAPNISYNATRGTGNYVAGNAGNQFDFVQSAMSLATNTYIAQNVLPLTTNNPMSINGSITESITAAGFQAGSGGGGGISAWIVPSGAANQKVSDCLANTTSFQCRFVNDAATAGTPWMTVNRSGTSATNITFGAPVIPSNGKTTTAVLTGCTLTFTSGILTASTGGSCP